MLGFVRHVAVSQIGSRNIYIGTANYFAHRIIFECPLKHQDHI